MSPMRVSLTVAKLSGPEMSSVAVAWTVTANANLTRQPIVQAHGSLKPASTPGLFRTIILLTKSLIYYIINQIIPPVLSMIPSFLMIRLQIFSSLTPSKAKHLKAP